MTSTVGHVCVGRGGGTLKETKEGTILFEEADKEMKDCKSCEFWGWSGGNSNSNSKTLLYKDYSLGSVKNLSNN